ncbi:MAG: metal-dependent transcriptional regulator [Saprospiraceae bacterium]|nr:metal-dependent transcriptional regulator [Saprospiraceae bacterium]
MHLSTAEENYLKAIFKISERSEKSASTNAIAKQLNTSPASVTDMLKRLSEKKFINYEKYKGVTLTSEGSKSATQLIRKHRLWEVFLVKKLRFTWDQVHEIAEQLEHIQSKELIMRLDAFLDYPKFDPHGDPIPNADGKFTIRNQSPLTDMFKGQTGSLVGVKEHQSDFLQYLNSQNIRLGSEILILEIMAYDKSMRIKLDQKREIVITNMVAQNLLVKKL